MDLVNAAAKFEVRCFTHSYDNSDYSFVWGLQTSNLEKGEDRESGMVTSERALVSSYRQWYCSIGICFSCSFYI